MYTVFTSFNTFPLVAVKPAKLTAMSVLIMYIVREDMFSSLSDLTKNVVLLYCVTTKFIF